MKCLSLQGQIIIRLRVWNLQNKIKFQKGQKETGNLVYIGCKLIIFNFDSTIGFYDFSLVSDRYFTDYYTFKIGVFLYFIFLRLSR